MLRLLQNLEDTQRPLLGPNYCFLKAIGFIPLKSKFVYLTRVLFHKIFTLYVVTEYGQLISVEADVEFALTNMKVSMLFFMWVIKMNTILLRQASASAARFWTRLLVYVTEANKKEREHQTEQTSETITKYFQHWKKVKYFYWVLTFTMGLIIIYSPFMKLFSSTKYRQEVLNVTEKVPQIFNSWTPFNTNNGSGGWFVLFWHSYVCMYGAVVTAAFDTTVVVMLAFFEVKLELLREKSKKIFNCFGNVEDTETQTRRLHDEHETLIENLRLLNSVLSPVMFVYMMVCSLMFCASAFQFTSAAGPLQGCLLAEYLVFGLTQLLLVCWHCSDAHERNEFLHKLPYESYCTSVPTHGSVHMAHSARSLLLLVRQFQPLHRFTAGPFTDLTLSTFLNIIKEAYSCYTLLNKDKKS